MTTVIIIFIFQKYIIDYRWSTFSLFKVFNPQKFRMIWDGHAGFLSGESNTTVRRVNYQQLVVMLYWSSCSRPRPATDNIVRDGIDPIYWPFPPPTAMLCPLKSSEWCATSSFQNDVSPQVLRMMCHLKSPELCATLKSLERTYLLSPQNYITPQVLRMISPLKSSEWSHSSCSQTVVPPQALGIISPLMS